MRTVLQWYQHGGPFIWPLVLVGVLGVVLLAERISYLVVRSKIHARPFMEEVITLVRAGKLDEALALCTDHQSALPDFGIIVLRSRERNETDLQNVADAALLSIVPSLSRRLSWMPTLANLAVLLGILGGIANLHDALSAGSGIAVQAGVASALRPLGVGVLTAIPLVAGHSWLTGEATKLVTQLEEFSARLINALIQRPDVRLGHRD
ncbi:MAG TPA: MotA/TolQ/ExbB proton channel family protein [Gemmatimonadaceae bacterium]|nr:MotA/TolQ/ExbB proton channel family protein [Gemmatimonadaceae bacterium]